MDYARELWQSGLDGQLIEILISHAFRDFAPYAGAEHQRLTIVRHNNAHAATKLILEDNSDFLFNVYHTGAGSALISTTGICQIDANPVIPLPPPPRRTPSSGSDNNSVEPTKQRVVSKAGVQQEQQQPFARPRFFSSPRGAQLLYGVQPVAMRREPGSPVFGQLELEGHLHDMAEGRHAIGMSLGPLTAKLSSNLIPPQASESPELSNSSLMDTSDPSKTAGRRQWTVDAACCIPLGGDRSVVGSEEEGRELRQAPWSLTLGVQHPFQAGDSLVALALQSDRAVSSVIQGSGAPDGLDSVELPLFLSSQKSNSGDDGGKGSENKNKKASSSSNTFAVPSTTCRFLVVQTVASSAANSAANGSMLSGGRSSKAAASMVGQSWRSLPTLVGCNFSFMKNLVRLSVATIFHDGEMDLETAAVLDATPWVPSTPTLLKLGWNNTGRIAVGIQSLFYDALSVTLGIHAMPHEDMRFGLEVSF